MKIEITSLCYHTIKVKKIVLLWSITLISTILVWLPFFSQGKMDRVFANYDGPNYIVVAKCWYSKECIRKNFSLPLPLEYYPAHFPGYPALIALLDQFLPGWWAMMIANCLGVLAMITVFYQLLKDLKLPSPLWLSLIILFLPARMLVLHSVGAPETWFIATLLFSILMYRRKKYFWSGISLALAQSIKTPAVLLLLALCINLLINEYNKENNLRRLMVKIVAKGWPLVFPVLVVLLIFFLYLKQTGDFWAYFHSGDNFHLVFPPLQAFISSRSWLGDFWLEDIIYIYLIGGLAILYLLKKYPKDIVAIFPLVFYLATLFVAHRDISRYSAPLYPFWIIAFANLLKKKEFKTVFFLLLPAIYLYTINFITYNTAPIADWTPYY